MMKTTALLSFFLLLTIHASEEHPEKYLIDLPDDIFIGNCYDFKGIMGELPSIDRGNMAQACQLFYNLERDTKTDVIITKKEYIQNSSFVDFLLNYLSINNTRNPLVKYIHNHHVRTLDINLKDCPLDPSEGKRLSEFLTSLPDDLQSIKMKLKSRDYFFLTEPKRIAIALKKFKDLRHLEIYFEAYSMNFSGVEALADTFIYLNKLRILKLSFRNNCFRNETCETIAGGLSTLTELEVIYIDLSVNMMGLKGIQAIFSAFKNLSKLTRAKVGLHYNNIQTRDIPAFTAILTEFSDSLSSLDLDLSSNHIDLEGAKAIISALKTLKNLHYLNLNLKNNKLDQQAVHQLETMSAPIQLKLVL